MQFNPELSQDLQAIIEASGRDRLEKSVFEGACRDLHISKLYFTSDLGADQKFRNQTAIAISKSAENSGERRVIYDDGKITNHKLKFPYFRDGVEYLYIFMEFANGVEPGDTEVLRVFSDLIHIVISRRDMQKMIAYSEYSDGLTGIPNVVYLTKKYRECSAKRPGSDYLVIRLNLQNFKYVNDSAGAKAGDEAIIQYSRKICGFVGEDEGICRLGGDNFVLFVLNENKEMVLEKIRSVLISNLRSAPGCTFNITTWAGISELKEGEDKDFLERLSDASAACSLAKEKFRKSIVYFDERIKSTIEYGRNITALFRPAVQKHEFQAFFQPKVDMGTGELVGFESLCRWKHDGHYMYPDQFIPVLDSNSLIQELDLIIFSETCSALRQWQNMGLKAPRISSNFSKKDLFMPDIENKIISITEDFNLSPDDIEIEITETVKETEYKRLIDFVNIMKRNGFHISIDDFGTGYSSLSLIHSINADTVKIDRSFITKLPADVRSKILIDSILHIASRLKMSVIAEGVETAEQGRALMDMGCSIAQGYYYSKPVDFDEATRIVEEPGFRPI